MEYNKKAEIALKAATEIGVVVKGVLLDDKDDPQTVTDSFHALKHGEFKDFLADMALGREEKQWRGLLVYKFVEFLITGAKGVAKTKAYKATAHVFGIDSSYARKLFKEHEGKPVEAEGLFQQFVQQHLPAALVSQSPAAAPTSMEAKLAEAEDRAAEAEGRAADAERRAAVAVRRATTAERRAAQAERLATATEEALKKALKKTSF